MGRLSWIIQMGLILEGGRRVRVSRWEGGSRGQGEPRNSDTSRGWKKQESWFWNGTQPCQHLDSSTSDLQISRPLWLGTLTCVVISYRAIRSEHNHCLGSLWAESQCSLPCCFLRVFPTNLAALFKVTFCLVLRNVSWCALYCNYQFFYPTETLKPGDMSHSSLHLPNCPLQESCWRNIS